MTPEHEAVILARYLIKRSPTRQVVELYSDAIGILNLSLDEREKKLWNFVLRRPWFLKFLDAGLAMNFPGSVLRRRILVMFAILETQAEYYSLFQPVRRPAVYILVMPYHFAKAAFKLAAGKVFVWLSLPK